MNGYSALIFVSKYILIYRNSVTQDEILTELRTPNSGKESFIDVPKKSNYRPSFNFSTNLSKEITIKDNSKSIDFKHFNTNEISDISHNHLINDLNVENKLSNKIVDESKFEIKGNIGIQSINDKNYIVNESEFEFSSLYLNHFKMTKLNEKYFREDKNDMIILPISEIKLNLNENLKNPISENIKIKLIEDKEHNNKVKNIKNYYLIHRPHKTIKKNPKSMIKKLDKVKEKIPNFSYRTKNLQKEKNNLSKTKELFEILETEFNDKNSFHKIKKSHRIVKSENYCLKDRIKNIVSSEHKFIDVNKNEKNSLDKNLLVVSNNKLPNTERIIETKKDLLNSNFYKRISFRKKSLPIDVHLHSSNCTEKNRNFMSSYLEYRNCICEKHGSNIPTNRSINKENNSIFPFKKKSNHLLINNKENDLTIDGINKLLIKEN